MYQRQRYYQHPSRRGGGVGQKNYLMPFLMIICVGIIGVLLFNLWRAFFPSEKAKAAYLHIVEGSAQMKAWGTESFFNLTTDSVIMQGDRIRSSADARFIVEFFDGTLMRMGGNADMSFDVIDDKSETPEMDLHLYSGDVWFNMLNKNTGHADVEVTTNNVVAKSNEASIFDVENDGDQIVRVISVFENEGLAVDVLSEDGEKVVETNNVGVGQQINFTNQVLETYWAHQSPTVLAAIDDDFKLTEWYLWNIKEDNDPTIFEKTVGAGGVSFVKVEPQVLQPTAEEKSVNEGEILPDGTVAGADKDANADATASPTTAQPATTVAPADSNAVAKPTITSVAGGAKQDEKGFYQVASRVTTLTGGIKGADKVVVNGYTLTKFKAGDTGWSYFANADFGLMKAGENVYEIYGLDASGKKGESLVVKVFYTPQQAAPVTTTGPEPAPVETETVPVDDGVL